MINYFCMLIVALVTFNVVLIKAKDEMCLVDSASYTAQKMIMPTRESIGLDLRVVINYSRGKINGESSCSWYQ